MTLCRGALAKNIFWQVAGQATIGTTASFIGIILSQTQIVLNTGAVLNGGALAQSAVNLVYRFYRAWLIAYCSENRTRPPGNQCAMSDLSQKSAVLPAVCIVHAFTPEAALFALFQVILEIAVSRLELSGAFLHLTFVFHAFVAGYFSDGLLTLAFRLFDSTFDLIFVHGFSPDG